MYVSPWNKTKKLPLVDSVSSLAEVCASVAKFMAIRKGQQMADRARNFILSGAITEHAAKVYERLPAKERAAFKARYDALVQGVPPKKKISFSGGPNFDRSAPPTTDQQLRPLPKRFGKRGASRDSLLKEL